MQLFMTAQEELLLGGLPLLAVTLLAAVPGLRVQLLGR